MSGKKGSIPGVVADGHPSHVLKWVIVFLPLGWLWFQLVNSLRLEWATNPQYSYGLVVPLLVIGLLARRWNFFPGDNSGSAVTNPWSAVWFCGWLAFLFLPTRLVEAATPEWRPIQWLLGFEVTGLTLYMIYLAGGKSWLRQAAFPVLFFLVAIPWPTPIEQFVIQGLTRLNAALVVEVLGILGVPAMQHGNVIEVSTGMVGINDACSGIRSLQSSLMISLFLGEFYRFSRWWRLCLLPIGFALAMGLNLFRASLLTWLAANKGMAAIAEYHDEAGFTIMLACTAGLWGVAWILNRWQGSNGDVCVAAPVDSNPAGHGTNLWKQVNRFAIALIIWIMLVEVGVVLWYQIRESHLKTGPSWTVKLPEDNATYKEVPVTKDENVLLRFDQSKQGQWQDPDGTGWEVFYFNWQPGRVAGYLAKRHTPDICLSATGMKMTAGPKLDIIHVNGVVLPMRDYTFETSNGSIQVFQCHWEAGLDESFYSADESSRFNLIRGIWAGRGNQGQKVLEIVITGFDNQESARQALVRQLGTLIKVAN